MTKVPVQILTLLERQARVYPSREALVAGNQRLSYGALFDEVIKTAAHLAERGIGAGDRIAVMADNGVEFIFLLLAAARRGAVIVPINVRLSTEEISYILADVTPKLVVYTPSYGDTIRKTAMPSSAPLSDLTAREREASASPADETPVSLESPWLIIHTAAVHGQPRGAILTHGNLLATAIQLAHLLKLTEEDRHLCLLPLFHIGGIAFFCATMLMGGCTVFIPRFEASTVPSLIARERVTFFITFPPMLASILAAEDQPAASSSLRLVGGVDNPETIRRFLTTYPQASFTNIYGQTECMPIAASPFSGAPGLVGPPTLLTHLTIRDDEDRDLAAGEAGEICVQSPAVFAGYWGREDETHYTTRGGWHHTGDLGVLDNQGQLTFTGRKPEKDLIKTGGENVYPQEVEGPLRTHEAIREACVIGLPDPQWGEAVVALCALEDGKDVTEEEIIAYVAQRIARYKKPQRVFFVSVLPRHANGTIDREAAKALGMQLLTPSP